MTPEDDDADSVLRALAAAPPVKPPERVLTAMVIKLADAAPIADQIDSVRALVEAQDAQLTTRDDGLLAVLWADATKAAGAALELRDALPETRIALATGKAGPAQAGRVVERALALLAAGSERICIDADTAAVIEPKFELERSDERIVLVEPLASGTPTALNRVIGNYKIVRLLGTGGMGVVYLAEHVTLGRKAVIKFVQDRLHQDSEYTTRFFTEAKTAASIRHPGIVDVFDYGKDDRGRGYIVMEYLDGESLRTRLRREKPMAPELAVTLGAQMANAVAAAHTAAIIHRDLKPDNLFLVPDPDSAQRVRAKVLDFGLAKVTADPSPGVTQSGNFVGTPLYMSPEQCRSKAEIDHRTDIYSLGCILFEMVTGRPPFTDKTVGDLIIAHNTITPPRPSELVDAVPPALERAILKALAKHPDDRHATMADFASALTQIAGGAPAISLDQTVPARPAKISAPPPITEGAQRASAVSLVAAKAVPPQQRRAWLVGAAAAAVLALGAFAFVTLRGRGATHIAAADGRNAIAVIDFENKDKKADTAWLSTALGETVSGDLGAGGQLQLVPAADTARSLTELKLGDQAEWTKEQLGGVRSQAGAEYVLAGSYRSVGGGELRVEAKLYDTASGKVVAHTEQSGLEADLGELGARISKAIKKELGVKVDEVAPVAVVLPADPTAAKLYAEGLAKLRRLELTEARDALTRASYAAPNDPLVHAALAQVWRGLGYDAKARTEAKQAFDASATLPDEARRAIEAQYRESTGQWEEAIAAYKKLTTDYPTRLDYGLALAAAEVHAGDVKSAYATLALLRKLPPPAGYDPRIELAESEAAEVADDVERMREHAQKAALLARKRGAGLLLAKALFREGWALFTLGRYDEADARNSEAKQLFTDLGDRSGVARTLNNMALALHSKHRDSDAQTAFAQALALAQEVGDTQAQAWVLHNWGYLLADTGDLTKAVELIQKKLDLGIERGVTASSLAAAHVNLSEILRWRGDLAGAQEHCNAAEDLLRGTDARRFAAYLALHCGYVLRAKDDLPGAMKRFDQAVGWASDVMQPRESAEMRIAKARGQLDLDQLDDAETTVRGAIADLRAAKEGSQQVCAIAVLASILLAKNQVDSAAMEIEATKSLPPEGVSFACRLEAEGVAAFVAWRQDPTKADAAVAALEDARKRAADATFVQLELQIRLLLGQVQGPRGKQALRSLVHDATAKDFKLVARKAGEAAAK